MILGWRSAPVIGILNVCPTRTVVLGWDFTSTASLLILCLSVGGSGHRAFDTSIKHDGLDLCHGSFRFEMYP